MLKYPGSPMINDRGHRVRAPEHMPATAIPRSRLPGGGLFPKGWGVIAALGSGALLALSLPGAGLSAAAWFALLPLLLSLKGRRPRSAFGLGLITGTFAAVLVLRFFPSVIARLGGAAPLGVLLLLVLALYFGLYAGAFASLVAWSHGRSAAGGAGGGGLLPVLFPAGLWVSLELLHTHLFPGLPWTFIFLGYSQWNHPALIQIADLAGVYGVSFVIALANAAVASAFADRRYRGLALVAVLLPACLLYGCWRMSGFESPEGERKIKVAVLQGNIEASAKWEEGKETRIAERYLDLCRRAADFGPDLIVWTETAIPWPLRDDDDLVEAALRASRPSGAYHLIGNPFPAPGEPGRYHNSALRVAPDGRVTGHYRKSRLLAFAEAAPVRGSRPWFTAHPASAGYISGGEPAVLATPLGRFGVSICNENSYPGFARRLVRRGAEYLVNLTNDAWFPEPTPIEWHYMLNIFRAVENRRETVVASNIGISGVISAAGKTRERSRPLVAECLRGEVSPLRGVSPYARWGDVFSFACASGALLSLARVFFSGRER